MDKKETVLIVDDMLLNIKLLSNILESDYNIIFAGGGREAIETLKNDVPDLILLDLMMPDIDGFDVMRFVKGNPDTANVPVIFVTGNYDERAEEKGLSLGAVDYIRKPFNKSIISSKIRNHLDLKAYRDNLELVVKKRTRELAASREAIIMGMSLMSEYHDKITGSHIQRIKLFTKILAKKLMEMYPGMLTEPLYNDIVLFSPLHDIGKIGISDSILHKKGLLTNEEFRIMQMHSLDGGSLLRQTEGFFRSKVSGSSLKVAIEIAECHHEKYDGTGYPRGMKGEDIPLSARIVAIADVYDALRSPRPYKSSLTDEDAMDIMFNGDNRTKPEHFDPIIMEVFRLVHDDITKIYVHIDQ